MVGSSKKARVHTETIVLPIGVATWAHLDKPDTEAPEGSKFVPDGKYKVTVLFTDEEELAGLKAACKRVAQAHWGDDVDFEEIALPLKEASREVDGEQQDFIAVTAKSKYKPSLIDAKRKTLPASVKIYSGDQGRIKVVLVPYEKPEQVREGKKIVTITRRGVTARLVTFQLVYKRGGGGSATDGFDDIDDGYAAPDDDADGSSRAPADDEADF
jgi:hypothetical protein